jgi:hypothetical protein
MDCVWETGREFCSHNKDYSLCEEPQEGPSKVMSWVMFSQDHCGYCKLTVGVYQHKNM